MKILQTRTYTEVHLSEKVHASDGEGRGGMGGENDVEDDGGDGEGGQERGQETVKEAAGTVGGGITCDTVTESPDTLSNVPPD